MVTLVVVGITVFSGGGDSPSSKSAAVSTPRPRSESGSSTTAAPETTAVAQQIALNPVWPQKGSSRYSDSEESKQLHDQLGPLVSSTQPIPATTVTGAKGPTTTTVKGARPTTTQRSATTVKAPVVTPPSAAPATAEPVPASPPETTAPAVPAANPQSIVTPTP